MAVSVLAAAAAQASSLDHKHPVEGQSSLSSSPRQYPTDLSSPILEEGDETESEPINEPVTPVSGRQSQDFQNLPANHPDIHPDTNPDSLASSTTFAPVHTEVAPASKSGLVLDTSAATSRPTTAETSPRTARPPPTPSAQPDQEPAPTPISRRSTRSSISGVKRTMSNFFRRSNSQTDKAAFGLTEPGYIASSDPNLQEAAPRKMPNRRWSMNRSSNTTRSNTPPSPSSPLEMAVKTREQASTPTVPNSDQFFQSDSRKNRASTGFHLRSKVGFAGSNEARPQHQAVRRRASSFDYSKQEKPSAAGSNDPIHMERALWGMPAESGTGVKARRMSLSLPDDFTVDVAELLAEFEYQHKFLGRHGKHLGKGATSKVTLMVRKGCPTELYAVKEFRGKSSSETAEEYEKKIKSEYTLAKSLHHPNIVETIRLCTDHGRWNHVMEYCQEGDLFTMVNKKYLKAEDREKDRLCLFRQLVQGINYLHANGVAHRDIKLENLLLTTDSKLKITDFGVSEVFSGIHPGLREAGGQCGKNMGEMRLCAPGICGSEPYIAPEVLKKDGRYDPRALDVWSSAIVMINLIFGAPLWQRAELAPKNPKPHPNYVKLVRGWEKWEAKHSEAEPVITEADYPKVDAFDFCVKPPALRRILLQMLNPEPSKRITIPEVLNNRWFKNIECCQLESYEDPAKMIDASKKTCLNRGGQRKIFCHNHLPPREHNTHSLGKMPGSAGY
ncbi:Pkinase-domain-containing protein [Thozetella sp. PMI_491]|nr:Pkinase-domain-containing protein [Thozetella sp. PMI_491]